MLFALLSCKVKFDFVFNSFEIGLSKRQQQLFPMVLARMGKEACRVVFVDDDLGNIHRARDAGVKALLYRGKERFLEEIKEYFLLP